MAHVIIELLILFVFHNVRKPLHLETLSKAFTLIHNIMCIAKAYRVRFMDCQWTSLWLSLMRMFELLSVYNEPKDREKITFVIKQVCTKCDNFKNVLTTFPLDLCNFQLCTPSW